MIEEDIVKVCEEFEVPYGWITSNTRRQFLSELRCACVYALYMTGKYSGVEISEAFHKKAHTLANWALKKVRMWRSVPKAYKVQLEYVDRALHAMLKQQIHLCIRKMAEDLNALYLSRKHTRNGIERLTDGELKRLGEIIEDRKKFVSSLNSFTDEDFISELSAFKVLHKQIGKWHPIVLITHTENENNPELKTLWVSICEMTGEIGSIINYYNRRFTK